MKTILSLQADLAAGRTTSVALVESALDNIQRHRESGGAAYVHVDAERALAAARASDMARVAGTVASPLAGLPVSIKDLFDVQGEFTRAGSKALAPDAPALQDAPTVARLRQAGAILLGRTNMSEFAFSGLGWNPHYGTPRSPFDATRVSGGSTSGGAVSVAGDMAVAALGTDTGGSIRIPSAFCGLTGFKPTARRVPLTGAVPLSTSLDSAGPLARSVSCCAIVEGILSNDPLDATPARLDGLRLYVTRDYVFDGIDDSVARAFEATLSVLSARGARIVPFDFPELGDLPAINAGGGFTAAEAWAWHRELLGSHGEDYDQRVAQRIRRGKNQSASDYIDLLAARLLLQQTAARRLQDADAWLMPTVAVEAPTVQSLEGADEDFFAINGKVLRNATVINFLDGCATALPTHTNGIGYSVCGLAGQDARILKISAACEAAMGTAA